MKDSEAKQRCPRESKRYAEHENVPLARAKSWLFGSRKAEHSKMVSITGTLRPCGKMSALPAKIAI